MYFNIVLEEIFVCFFILTHLKNKNNKTYRNLATFAFWALSVVFLFHYWALIKRVSIRKIRMDHSRHTLFRTTLEILAGNQQETIFLNISISIFCNLKQYKYPIIIIIQMKF